MHGLKGAFKRLNWIWGALVAALIVAGAATPAAARHHPAQLSAPSDHKAWAPVNGHHFDLNNKHHRAFHNAVRRSTPDPVLVSRDAGVPSPSRLEPITAAADLTLLCADPAPLPPPTGPPAV